jgi:1-acyl-sn-glycerol-3-phosphate acyltransferase
MAEPTIAERVAGSPVLRRRQALGRRISHCLGRVEILGLGVVPTSGPVLLAANHRSLLDGVLLFGAVQRPVSCLVKAEAFTPRLSRLLRSAGQIPVRREIVDAGAVRLCLRTLRAGGIVGIFPEGTRGHGRVETAKPGVGYLALRTGAVVIPVACAGTPEMAHRRTARRPPALILFGAPIAVDRWPDDRPLNRRVVAAATEGIRVALAALVALADDRAGGARRLTEAATTTKAIT